MSSFSFHDIGLGLVALALSKNFAAAIEAMSRNPESSDKVFGLAIIGAAFIEVAALLIFVIAILTIMRGSTAA